jgi:hypothetical protein
MIQTTLGKVYSAFIATNQIRNMVKGTDALHLFHLRNMLKESVDFMAEEDVRMVAEAGGTIMETGMVIIADKEKRSEYAKARKELDNQETEILTDPIRIRIAKCPDVTAEQIELLDGFVIFEEEVDKNGNE